MEFANVGASGLLVSKVGLGCNSFGPRLDAAASRLVIHAALDSGITLFDTADVYGRGASETILGDALGERRKDVVLATKFSMPMDDAGRLRGASRRYIFSAVEASLRRLKTDWIDLYQHHQPDPATPLEESLRALEDLTRQGKIRYAGLSNHDAWQVVDAAWIARGSGFAPLVSCQDHYSLLHRRPEDELIPAMQRFGLGLLPYFPLAGGLLTGKYRRGESAPAGSRLSNDRVSGRFMTDSNWNKTELLRSFAESRGRSLLELAVSWLARQPVVASVIAGVGRVDQIASNVAAASWQLDNSELEEIDRLTKD